MIPRPYSFHAGTSNAIRGGEVRATPLAGTPVSTFFRRDDTARIQIDSRENFLKLQQFAGDYTPNVLARLTHYTGGIGPSEASAQV